MTRAWHGAYSSGDARFVGFPSVPKGGQWNCGVFLDSFRNKSVSITIGNRRRCVQLVLENHGHLAEPHFKAMFTPTTFEVLTFLHSLSVFHEVVKKLKVTKLYTDRIFIEWCVQVVTKASGLLVERGRTSFMAKRLTPYMWHNKANARFLFLSKRMQGLSTLKQLSTLRFLGSSLFRCKGVDQHAYSLSDQMDEAMRFDTYLLSDRLEFLILNHKLFIKSGKWLRLDKCHSQGDALPLVIAGLSRPVTTVLKIVAPRPPERVVVELDEYGNPIIFYVVSDAPASPLLSNLSMIYSQIPGPELGKWLHPPKLSHFCSVGSNHEPKRPCADYQGGERPSTATTDPEEKMEEEIINIPLPAASLDRPDDARATLAVLG